MYDPDLDGVAHYVFQGKVVVPDHGHWQWSEYERIRTNLLTSQVTA